MAAKNSSESKNCSDAKRIKKNDSSKILAVEALSASTKTTASGNELDSFYCENGLELYEHLTKVKYEADALKENHSIISNKSSVSSLNILKAKATATTPNVTVKKEETLNEESVVPTPTYTSTPMKPANGEAVEENSSNTTSAIRATADGNNKECNKVIRLATRDLSDEERKRLRAKRFNIIVADPSPNAKTITVKNLSVPDNQSMPTSEKQPTPTYNILKKRAERFGENVSTVMKSLDHKEKLLKRKLKFLESVTNLKELEIKKRRAERFRMV